MSTVVLGVCGSVAAYRAADLARELMREGHVVRVLLTDAASQFVTPALFEALTGQPCLSGVFEEPVRGRMAHIDWAREADVVVVAPATANTIAKLAHGIGEDMLTTLVLATRAPLVVAPAMNPAMYANEAHQAALGVLRSRAAVVVEPIEGEVACGDQGQGKLAPIPDLVAAVRTVLDRKKRLAGKRVLITSGPTREPIDGVRFLTNRSSGKMGSALARAALLLGADVTVVAGPQTAPLPHDAHIVRVNTAEEMLQAVLSVSPGIDLVIGAAAVADYRPEQLVQGKIRRGDGPMDLRLVPNPDFLATAARHFPNAIKVGFAAEPDASLEVALAKLQRKGLDAVAANDVSQPGVGFDGDTNALTLIRRDGSQTTSGLRTKLECAFWLLESLTPPHP